MRPHLRLLGGSIALALAGAAIPAQAAFGPFATFTNTTDRTLILAFDGTKTPAGNAFHVRLSTDPPGRAAENAGSSIADLTRRMIALDPKAKLYIFQHSTGIASPSVPVAFKTQLHLEGSSRTLPAVISIQFDYPVPDPGAPTPATIAGTVTVDGTFPSHYNLPHHYVFTKKETPRPELVLSETPATTPAHGGGMAPSPGLVGPPGGPRPGDAWHGEYRNQAPKTEDPAARMKREFEEKARLRRQREAEEKKGPHEEHKTPAPGSTPGSAPGSTPPPPPPTAE